LADHLTEVKTMTDQSASPRRIAPGTQVVVKRFGYRHYGISAGAGRVIHYAGLISHPHGLIEETSLVDFARGHELVVGPRPACGDAILRRARSRLGEAHYDLFTNNCEHFSNWCQTGQHRSRQAEAMHWPTRMVIRWIHGLCAWSSQARVAKA
jgi:lecithin:retinol acyltransferase